MKRILAMLLAALMLLSVMTGCGGSTEETTAAATAAKTSAETDAKDTEAAGTEAAEDGEEKGNREDAYTVTMVFPYTVDLYPDWEKVEAAMSDYCFEMVGANFAFKSVPFFSYTDLYTLWAASGEQVDLWLLTSDLRSYVEDGTAEPITEYYENGLMPNLERLGSELNGFVENGYLDGELYRVGVIQPTQGGSGALYLRKDVFDGIEYTDDGTGKELYTYEDLDEIFAQVKEAFPELVVIDQCGTKTSTSSGLFFNYDGFASNAAGVIMNNQGTEIVNLFETDEYREYVEWMRSWYLAGYFDPDCATTSETSDEWMYAKKVATFGFAQCTPDYKGIIELQYDVEFVSYLIKRMGITSNAYGSLGWIVSCNSENVEKSARVLDLMYEESGTLENYIMFGIEGEHYVMTDDEGIVDFPEGIDKDSVSYYYTLGLYGDKRKYYMWVPETSETRVAQEEFTAWSQAHASDIVGYTYDTSNVQDEIAAISQVYSKYLSTLEYGLADVDETLLKFQNELKAAGIESVIEDNREQLSAWLAQ